MADNRQFTDHNSIGNVNVYYKDRQLKERTAVSNAASIANLKFLLTTGDDEGFRTAIKSYIDEAIRSALGALVDNLDKGTGVSRILGTDSSHDLGTITPANLASVLGAAVIDMSSNIDNLRTPGIYQTMNGQFGAIAIVWKYDSQFIFQLSMDVNATDINPRVRMWVGNATTPYWTEWKEL